MRTALTVGWLAVYPAGCAALIGVVSLSGCAADGGRVEYIPGDRALVPLEKGEPAPSKGWFVPPALMQEMIPCLDERFRNGPESSDESPEPNGLLDPNT